MDLLAEDFDALTFDCYGTLVDWKAGMRAALAELPGCRGCDIATLLRDRDECERMLEAGPYRTYAAVLRDSLGQAARRQGRELPHEDLARFAASVGRWPAFPDCDAALERLGRFRLAILSNVDRADLEETLRAFGDHFELLVTAEDVRAYKPASDHFEEALRSLDLPAGRVLHVACSPFHDLAPARGMGWPAVWISRGTEVGANAPEAEAIFPDLAALAAHLVP